MMSKTTISHPATGREQVNDQELQHELGLLPSAIEANARNDEISRQWNNFVSGKTVSGVRNVIVNSWQRSLDARIDAEHFDYQCVVPDTLSKLLSEHRQMIDAASGIMQNLLAYNPDGHINLTDNQGVTLAFCGLDLTPVGSILREEVLGTNCTALCLIEKKPVFVLSAENWKASLRARRRQCAAAPVNDAQGNLVGVLTLTASQEFFNYHTLGTVQAAAEAIGQQMMLKDLLEEQRSILETLNEGVIVTDAHGVITAANRYARQIFNGVELITGRHIDAILHPQGESLVDLQPCIDHEVNFTPSASVSVACLLSLMVMPNGKRIVSLKENQRIRAITRKMMGPGARYTFDRIIGSSAQIRQTLERARASSRTASTVLLTGESGTGKELFSQAIHLGSERHSGPFVAVNCGAIPRDLVQSELFGYVGGAYTGAKNSGAPGKFELADGGTLFLDEIGEMPLEAQTSLLRVLQEGEVVRVGGTTPTKVDVRIIAATNCDLVKAVAESAFRQDLYYRLNVVSIEIPALRERAQDVEELVTFFTRRICDRLKQRVPEYTPQAIRVLKQYPWPGNVRELENIVERVINMHHGMAVDIPDLPREITQPATTVLPRYAGGQHDYTAVPAPAGHNLRSNETQHIAQVLSDNKGNVKRSAEQLGISRNALYEKLKKAGLQIQDFR